MESKASRLVKYYLRLIKYNQPYKTGKFDLDKIRKDDISQPGRWMCRGCTVTHESIGSNKVWHITPHQVTNSKILFYLHGGAFLAGMVKQQWNTIAKIGKLCYCQVIIPEYPLAPENNYRDALNMILAAYKKLLLQNNSSDIIFIGDSAGGGLMFSFALLLREHKIELPAKLIALSPWVDVSMVNPEAKNLEAADPLIQVAGLKKAGELYADGQSPAHPLISPLYGDIKDFPETHIFAGTHDILQPDEKLFAEKAIKNKIEMHYHEYPGMIHGWMFLPIPEAKKAVKHIVDICLDNPDKSNS